MLWSTVSKAALRSSNTRTDSTVWVELPWQQLATHTATDSAADLAWTWPGPGLDVAPDHDQSEVCFMCVRDLLSDFLCLPLAFKGLRWLSSSWSRDMYKVMVCYSHSGDLFSVPLLVSVQVSTYSWFWMGMNLSSQSTHFENKLESTAHLSLTWFVTYAIWNIYSPNKPAFYHSTRLNICLN